MKTLGGVVLVLAAVALLAAGCQSTTVRGPAGQEMTAVVPQSILIMRGETKAVAIQVDREKMAGDVTMTMSQLPGGVTVDDASRSIVAGQSQATFIVTASPKAGLVNNQAVKITVNGPNGLQSIQYMKLTVQE